MTRRVNAAGLALVKRFEGFSPVVYADVAGRPTIGYGHLLHENAAISTITEQEAEALLRADLASAEAAVSQLIRAPLNENQYAALVCFTFNLGAGALQRSTLRQCVNRGEHDAAAEQFLRWIWAGGRKWAGLLRRREAERRLYCAAI